MGELKLSPDKQIKISILVENTNINRVLKMFQPNLEIVSKNRKQRYIIGKYFPGNIKSAL